MTSPRLRFPGFDSEWKPVQIGSLIERVNNVVDVDPEADYREIGVRSHGKGIFHKEPIIGENLGNKRVFHVVPNALVLNIVFAWERAIALTSDAEIGFIASHRFPMFIEREGQGHLAFLRHFFLTKRGKQFLEIASPGGAGRNKTLGQNSFLKLAPTLPTRNEQKRISDAIDAVDAKLAALLEKKEALTQFKTGLTQQIFTQRTRFARDDGTSFPDWGEERLDKLGNFLGGGTPDTNIEKYWNGHVPWISSTDVDDGSIYELRPTRHISEQAIASSATKLVPTGSILIVTRVGVGKLVIADTDVCTSQDFSNFIPEKIGTLFLAYWLQFSKRRLLALAQGTSIKGISLSELRKIVVDVPHSDEQDKIANCLRSMDAQIQATSQKAARLDDFKRGLLQQIFV